MNTDPFRYGQQLYFHGSFLLVDVLSVYRLGLTLTRRLREYFSVKLMICHRAGQVLRRELHALWYFRSTAWLLEEDPSLFCVSAWNDNHSCDDVSPQLSTARCSIKQIQANFFAQSVLLLQDWLFHHYRRSWCLPNDMISLAWDFALSKLLLRICCCLLGEAQTTMS